MTCDTDPATAAQDPQPNNARPFFRGRLFPKRSSKGRLRARRLPVLVSGIAVAVAASLLSVAPANAAVSALSYYPTFGCTSNAINVAQVSLNQNIGTVRVEAEAEIWTGSWAFAAWSGVATVNTNAMFSELNDPTFNFTASNNRYFEVFIWTSVNGAAWTYYPAEALRDAYSTYICHTV